MRVTANYVITLSTVLMIPVISGCGTNGQLLLDSVLDNAIGQLNDATGQVSTAVADAFAEELTNLLFNDGTDANGLPNAQVLTKRLVLSDGPIQGGIRVKLGSPIKGASEITLVLMTDSAQILPEIPMVSDDETMLTSLDPVSANNPAGLGDSVGATEVKITDASLNVTIPPKTAFTIPVAVDLTIAP